MGWPAPVRPAAVRGAVPRVRLEGAGEGARLVWDAGPIAPGEPLDGVWDFLALAEAGDAEILAFARRHGVLGLERGGNEAGSEPVAAWQAYARGLRAVLGIAAALRQGRHTRLEEWALAAGAAVTLAEPASLDGDSRQRLAEGFAGLALYVVLDQTGPGDLAVTQHRLFERLMAELLARSGLRPSMVVDEAGRGRLGLALPVAPSQRPGSTAAEEVGRLADILLAAACEAIESEGLGRCDVCGRPFRRSPDAAGPRSDRRTFCSEACRRQAKREVQRDSARRRAAARRATPAGA